MENMKCIECCLKHLAAALSYGKEIISGHDSTNALDHRIDLLGEIVNLQHHVELINNEIFNQVTSFRKSLQNKRIQINQADLQVIRHLYNKIQIFNLDNNKTNENVVNSSLNKQIRNNNKYKVIINDVKDIQKLKFAVECIKTNILNETEIYVIGDLDFSNIDVSKHNGNIKTFVESLNENEQFIYMKENYFIINKFDFNLLPNIYLQQKAEGYKSKYFPFKWTCGAPHVMKKQLFLNTYEQEKDIETNYFIKNQQQPLYNSSRYVIRLQDKLCCGNKGRIRMVRFATSLSQLAFSQIKNFFYSK